MVAAIKKALEQIMRKKSDTYYWYGRTPNPMKSYGIKDFKKN